MTSAPPDTESNLWPAVLLFSAVYLGVSALVTAILVGFDIDANSGVATGVASGGALVMFNPAIGNPPCLARGRTAHDRVRD